MLIDNGSHSQYRGGRAAQDRNAGPVPQKTPDRVRQWSQQVQKIALCTLSLSMCNIERGMTRTN
jgi:hypothetical protein